MSARYRPYWISTSLSGALASVVVGWTTIAASAELTDLGWPEQRSGAEGNLQLAQATDSENRVPSTTQDGLPATNQLQPRTFDELDTATSGLNDALAGAQAKLERLREATEMAGLAARLREELQIGAEENNRLSAALTEAEASHRGLMAGQEAAADKIAELTSALQRSRSEAGDLNQQLRQSREKTTVTDVARSAAEKRANQAERQLADSRDQNQALTQQISAVKDQLTSVRQERDSAKVEIGVTRQERDDAHQELDKIRLRIAGLLRSVLHADDSSETEANRGAALANPEIVTQGTGQQAYEIVRTSNVRAEPRPDAERVDMALTGEIVSVLRKIDEDNWFEIETKRGVRGFIFGELIRPAT